MTQSVLQQPRVIRLAQDKSNLVPFDFSKMMKVRATAQNKSRKNIIEGDTFFNPSDYGHRNRHFNNS